MIYRGWIMYDDHTFYRVQGTKAEIKEQIQDHLKDPNCCGFGKVSLAETPRKSVCKECGAERWNEHLIEGLTRDVALIDALPE